MLGERQHEKDNAHAAPERSPNCRIERHARNLRRRRCDVRHFRRTIDGTPRTPIGAATDQRERRADVCPADRFYEQPHGSAVLQDLGGKRVQGRLGRRRRTRR